MGSVPDCEAQSVVRLTAEREIAGSIPGDGPVLRVFKYLRNEDTPFALQMARPSRGSNDHVKRRSHLHWDVKIAPSISSKYTDTKIKCVFMVVSHIAFI